MIFSEFRKTGEEGAWKACLMINCAILALVSKALLLFVFVLKGGDENGAAAKKKPEILKNAGFGTIYSCARH